MLIEPNSLQLLSVLHPLRQSYLSIHKFNSWLCGWDMKRNQTPREWDEVPTNKLQTERLQRMRTNESLWRRPDKRLRHKTIPDITSPNSTLFIDNAFAALMKGQDTKRQHIFTISTPVSMFRFVAIKYHDLWWTPRKHKHFNSSLRQMNYLKIFVLFHSYRKLLESYYRLAISRY